MDNKPVNKEPTMLKSRCAYKRKRNYGEPTQRSGEVHMTLQNAHANSKYACDSRRISVDVEI